MFNGIIYNQGTIKSLRKNRLSLFIEIETSLKFKQNEIGSSVCCNGVCLTLVKILKNSIFFYLSNETLSKSNFKKINLKEKINLEKSLVFGNKISGHYTQGHVDTTGVIKKISIIDKSWTIQIKISNNYKKYIVEKGSVSVNGVSLTVSKIDNFGFEITIIPHTLKMTNLTKLKKNNIVNIEFDIFGKYLIDLKK
jgi:riboflavin synthase